MAVITVAACCVDSAWILCVSLPSEPATLQSQCISHDLVHHYVVLMHWVSMPPQHSWLNIGRGGMALTLANVSINNTQALLPTSV